MNLRHLPKVNHSIHRKSSDNICPHVLWIQEILEVECSNACPINSIKCWAGGYGNPSLNHNMLVRVCVCEWVGIFADVKNLTQWADGSLIRLLHFFIWIQCDFLAYIWMLFALALLVMLYLLYSHGVQRINLHCAHWVFRANNVKSTVEYL